MRRNRIAIGTRGSKLALWQAEWVQASLKNLYPDLEVELVKIKTTGDRILDVPLSQVGGKGLFVKEIEEALLRHEVDIAVHSMKDVPTEFPDGLHLAIMCKREDPRDALIVSEKVKVKSKKPEASVTLSSKKVQEGIAGSLIHDFPAAARIGTSSLRRICQLLHIRPDIEIIQLRGNLDTRIRKLDEGQFDAVILAAAGMKRLGLQHKITEILPFEISLPAIGQGAIGIECRTDDEFINKLIVPLNHSETFHCVSAERAFLRRLEGGCQVPIAAHAKLADGHIIMDGLVGTEKGDRILKSHIEGLPVHMEQLGIRLAEDILSMGAKEILDAVYKNCARTVDGEISS